MEAGTMAPEKTDAEHQEDDGLGPVDDGSGIPGGEQEPKAEGEQPPTPPADLPDDGAEEDEEPSDQLFVLGDKELGLKVGGRKPDSSVLKFKGTKVDLGGQFDRGDRLTTVDVWQVTGDDDQDSIDTHSGDVKSTSKAQKATLCGTKRIEEWLFERLEGGLPGADIARVFDILDLEVPEA